MDTPSTIISHDAWKQYTADELAGWVHLLVKRAGMRTEPLKIAKDLDDASNYLDMLVMHGIHIFTVFGVVYTTATLRETMDRTRYDMTVGA